MFGGWVSGCGVGFAGFGAFLLNLSCPELGFRIPGFDQGAGLMVWDEVVSTASF